MPKLDFIGRVGSRDDRRSLKNRNWSLLKLKHSIMIDKLKKRIEKLSDMTSQLGYDVDDEAVEMPKKLKKILKKSEKWKSDLALLERDGPGALEVIKQNKKSTSNDLVNELTIANASQSDRPTIGRLLDDDDDDAVVDEEDFLQKSRTKRKLAEVSIVSKKPRTAEVLEPAENVDLSSARQEYLDKIRHRISSSSEQDKQREKDRIRAKRNKKKDQAVAEQVVDEEEEAADDDDQDDDNDET